MGALAVALAVVSYAMYAWQTWHGAARPHPLSWLIFGILAGTTYLVQLDQVAGPGSWVTGVTAVVCLLLCVMSLWQGERIFPWYEWAFLFAAAVIFAFYLWSRQPALLAASLPAASRDVVIAHGPAVSAVLATAVSLLGFGPTLTKAWHRPHSDSALTFMLNGLKFVPALLAMDSISVATCVFPVTLLIANIAVALVIYGRRSHYPHPR